jgi:hypothetical protein
VLGYLLFTNPASANFDLMVGAKALYGTNSSEDGDFASKSNSFNYGLETALGYSYGRFLVGVGGEYLLIDQLSIKMPNSLYRYRLSGLKVSAPTGRLNTPA